MMTQDDHDPPEASTGSGDEGLEAEKDAVEGEGGGEEEEEDGEDDGAEEELLHRAVGAVHPVPQGVVLLPWRRQQRTQ